MQSPVDISGFNRGLTGFVDQLGLSGPVVLKKEMGELVKTLVRITPGADSKKIRADISRKFETIGDSENSNHDTHGGGKEGNQGINWYHFTSSFIHGVAEQNDKRDASVEELKALSYQITRGGHRLNVPIKGHSRQRALIYQTILTRASTVKKLIAEKVRNRGRLKAGWLASWDFLKPSGGNQPPQFVMRHKSGARGYYLNGLGVKNFPSFTIANTAAGVGNARLNLDWIVQKALGLRAKAMKTNLALFMRGKKNLADYAK